MARKRHTAEKIVTDETPAEEAIPEYTAYVDPKYAEQIMAESQMEEAPAAPRKGPASETGEAASEHSRSHTRK